MPKPVAIAAAMIQRARALPAVARARLNKLTAVRLANRHSTAATPTRRQSCSTVRQVKTRNILSPDLNLLRWYGRKIYVSLTVIRAQPAESGFKCLDARSDRRSAARVCASDRCRPALIV